MKSGSLTAEKKSDIPEEIKKIFNLPIIGEIEISENRPEGKKALMKGLNRIIDCQLMTLTYVDHPSNRKGNHPTSKLICEAHQTLSVTN
ncbi:MAG: hypothetical protein QXS27_00635 [Candidatus Jordarchaeaceae archaeon]